MINAVLAYDDLDYDEHQGSLGDFFKGCAENFKLILDNHEYTLCELDSTILGEERIIEECGRINSQGFLILTYSHGLEDSLLHEYGGKKYITLENISAFNNSFFYTWSCSSGLKLGEALSKLGNVVFFGYTEDVIGIGEGSYMELFIKCANEGIRLFLNGYSVEDSYYGMLDFYKQNVFKLSENPYDALASSALSRNRRALIHYAKGLEDATIENFSI